MLKFTSLFLILFLIACQSTPFLEKNVDLVSVDASARAKDRIVIKLTIRNNNDFAGKVTAAATVNCGTVTWREKKETTILQPQSQSTVTIEFIGRVDRIPTMAKTFKYQGFIYGRDGRVLTSGVEKHGRKPYGRP
jgi:LEA14-like dessication related protein